MLSLVQFKENYFTENVYLFVTKIRIFGKVPKSYESCLLLPK